MSGGVLAELVVLWLVPAVWALVANVWPWPADRPPAPVVAPPLLAAHVAAAATGRTITLEEAAA